MVQNKNQWLCDVSSDSDTQYLFQNVLEFVGDFFLKPNKINHFGSVLSKQEICKVFATVFKKNLEVLDALQIRVWLAISRGNNIKVAVFLVLKFCDNCIR